MLLAGNLVLLSKQRSFLQACSSSRLTIVNDPLSNLFPQVRIDRVISFGTQDISDIPTEVTGL
jgi:hypothetical protein